MPRGRSEAEALRGYSKEVRGFHVARPSPYGAIGYITKNAYYARDMSKRIFLVHGWGGNPENAWFPWLRSELQVRGFEVTSVALPEPDTPNIETWIPALADAVGTADEQTFFVGHSLGCQAIARYLVSLPDDVIVGGAVFVAGFFKRLTNEEDGEEDHAIADVWLNTPIDLLHVRDHLPQSVAIFSDDDPSVPLENQNEFHNQLGSEIIVQHGKGHFSDSEGIVELPIVLEAVLRMSKN